jgi:hypothetical protein
MTRRPQNVAVVRLDAGWLGTFRRVLEARGYREAPKLARDLYPRAFEFSISRRNGGAAPWQVEWWEPTTVEERRG